jgi:hypothetical protein
MFFKIAEIIKNALLKSKNYTKLKCGLNTTNGV